MPVTSTSARVALTAALTILASAHLAVSPASAAPIGPHAVVAPIDGNKILAEVDRRATAFEDQRYSASMEIFKGGKSQKVLQFNAVMQGAVKQYIEFTAPGDVAGMKVLMENADTLYVYMPEFKKVRRVAAHVRNQGFMGSEFSYADMTEVQLSPFYNAEFEGKQGNETTLVLTPKAAEENPFSKLEVVIDSSKGGVTKVRYFDKGGALVREQLRDAWKKVGKHVLPTQVTMVNHKTNDRTVITLSNVQVNQGVQDDLFSRRTLLRG